MGGVGTARRARTLQERGIHIALLVVSNASLLILAGIFSFLLITGLRAFADITPQEFLLGTDWNPDAYGEARWGILGLVVSTILVTAIALLIAIPAGIAGAIYLAEIAAPRTREILKPVIELIAGIPSVVLGLVGILVLAPAIALLFGLSSGLNAFTAGIVVAIMVLPTIITITEDVLTAIPREFREASLALGSTKWQMIHRTVLPAALSGTVAACMLGLGRAVGETMAVLMVAGNARALPHGLFDPARTMTANIAIEIKEVVQGSTHFHALFAIGLALFALTFIVNLIADLIIERQTRKYRW